MTWDPNDPPMTRREARRRERLREAELASETQSNQLLDAAEPGESAAPAGGAPSESAAEPLLGEPGASQGAADTPSTSGSPEPPRAAPEPIILAPAESSSPVSETPSGRQTPLVGSAAASEQAGSVVQEREREAPEQPAQEVDADEAEASGRPSSERALTRRERRAMLQAQEANRYARGSRSRFDQDESNSGSSSAPNSLILPTIPPDITGPLTGGEVVVTGSIELPHSLSTTGTHRSVHDSPEVDSWLDAGSSSTSAESMSPVPASRAISARKSSEPVLPKQKGSGGKIPAILAGVAAVLAAGVAGVIVTGYAMGLF